MATGHDQKTIPGYERRMYVMMGVVAVAFFVLGARLWYLQIVEGELHADLSVNQRLHKEKLNAPRGRIYSRDTNVVLADTRPARDVVVIAAECDELDRVSARLEALLRVDGKALLNEMNAHLNSEVDEAGKRLYPYEQIYVKRDISRWELGRLSEELYALPGVHVMVRPQRFYVHGSTGGQLLGYLGEISPAELENRKPEYAMGDVIGRTGLERMYESMLRGSDGEIIVSRYASLFSRPQLRTDDIGMPSVAFDSRGRELAEMHRKDPVAGASLRTTIDLDLQREAERLLIGNVGSITAIQANTGEVLAMASSPGFDPNAFVTRGRSPERVELLNDKERPMDHRAFRVEYAPGSVYKIVMAIAAMEEGVISPETRHVCGGSFHIGGTRINCWRWRFGGHGSVNVVDALAQSCDVFFYEVGLDLGLDRIKAWSSKLGFGELTGIDLPGERPGLVPTDAWKREQVGPDAPRWEARIYPGEIAMVSIGQSYMLATPLQNAALMAIVLNGGRRVEPYLNFDRGPRLTKPLCSERTAQVVQEGLRQCVIRKKAPSGTGTIAQIDGYDVLAKTGTAQVVRISEQLKYGDEENIPYELRDHAWFVAGVLDRDPPLAVCVMVEHGHHGNTAAGPLARDIIHYFYERDPMNAPITMADVAVTE